MNNLYGKKSSTDPLVPSFRDICKNFTNGGGGDLVGA